MESRPRHLKRNFSLFLVDFIVFSMAFNMMGPSTVVPDFVKKLTDNPFLIGVSGSIFNICWLLPQLLLAQLINRASDRQAILRQFVVVFRSNFIILALIILIVQQHPAIILIVFLVSFGLFGATDGMISIIWADMLATNLPDRARSMLYSIGQLGVAFVALISSEVVRRVLAPDAPPFPQNYALLFGIAGCIFVTAGAALASIIQEKQAKPHDPGPSFKEYLPYLGNIWRTDSNFRTFVRTRFLFDIAAMSTPFYIVFGENALHLPSETIVGNSILVITAGSAVGSLLMGWLSRRSGSRAVMRVAGLTILLHCALALASGFLGVPALYVAFFILGMASAGAVPGFIDWIISHAPSDRRPIYFGLTNTISAISGFAPWVAGGLLALLFALMSQSSSYMLLFGLSSLMALLGLFSTLGLSEPRHKNRIVEDIEPALVTGD